MKIICENCFIDATTRYVKFYQNIGMLIMRLSETVEGNLCKSCIHKNFWKFSLTTLFLGWWGILSFFITPLILINNITRYVMSLGMERVPLHAQVPQLTDEVVYKLEPLTEYIIMSLNNDKDLDTILKDISLSAGCTHGQVFLYIKNVILDVEEVIEESEK